jgi:hypothetical protein
VNWRLELVARTEPEEHHGLGVNRNWQKLLAAAVGTTAWDVLYTLFPILKRRQLKE